MENTLLHAKKIYFVGIKGVAMTALALYAKGRGIKVSGCDVPDIYPTDVLLTKSKISVDQAFSPETITKYKPDAVIYTGAHSGRDNPVVKKAVERMVPIFSQGVALGIFMDGLHQLSVAGSHGKTTTSAMIATILEKNNKKPSWCVGCGEIFGLGNSGHRGMGNIFVAEADEYVTDPKHDPTPRFLWQKPEILVVTNIDYDHPDVYESLRDVQDAFISLQKQQIGMRLTIVNIDDVGSKSLLRGENVITVGFSPRADFQITHIGYGRERTFFTLSQKGISVGEFTIKVAGEHNVLNAVLASVACNAYGLSWNEIKDGLLGFGGITRRFQKIGFYKGITVYDDYAHHPAEIKATLKAARNWYPANRIIAIFQPHTYSRTHALLNDFANAFSDADMVILSDIYASAREHDTLGLTGTTLYDETAKFHKQVLYGKDYKAVSDILEKECREGDVVIFMGAGDIYEWSHDIVKIKKIAAP